MNGQSCPILLKAVPIGSGGITLQWSSNVGHYDIYIRDKAGRPVPEAPDIVGGATSENYHDFFGLQPDKEYFFFIRARTEGGTQGCVSKNASETVSARTDPADLNNACDNYARTAMEDIKETQAKQCKLPGTADYRHLGHQRTHPIPLLPRARRAHLQGDANAQWAVRNQDLVACKDHANKCGRYRTQAVFAAMRNRFMGCGYKGARWQLNGNAHYAWCMGLGANSIAALEGDQSAHSHEHLP